MAERGGFGDDWLNLVALEDALVLRAARTLEQALPMPPLPVIT